MNFIYNNMQTYSYLYAIAIFLLFQLFRVVLRKIIFKIIAKTKTTIDDGILTILHKPIDYLFVFIGIDIAKNVLVLSDNLNITITHIINSGYIILIFWSFIRILDYFIEHLSKITTKFKIKISDDLANFFIKAIRFFTYCIAVIVLLQEWDYNVSGFLASLGLVGMAFALAAKDTASNLFGSLVIFTDKPFKIGDWIKTPQVEGTIESVGIRSTKVRTFAQAMVTVPNGTLANSAILNWSRMGKRRVKMNIGLTYDTKSSDIENVIKDIKAMLRSHSDIDQDTIHIYFSAFEDSSLNIFCYYFTKTIDWGKFMEVREDTYFKIMKIVEQNNSGFAYPTQTIKIDKEIVE